MTPRVVRATAETGPVNIDIAMNVDLELDGGVTARMTCANEERFCDQRDLMARGDRGELA